MGRAVRHATAIAILTGAVGLRGGGDYRDEIVLPFDAFRFSAAQEAEVGRALQLLATACMRQKGFATFEWAAPRPRAEVLVVDNSRRYGVASQAVARSFGYHKPPERAEIETRMLLAWQRTLPADVRSALVGRDGDGGCRRRAADALLRNVPGTTVGWFTQLDFGSLDRSERDPMVIAAMTEWSSCMAERGHRYRDVWAPPADPRFDLDSPTPSRLEVQIAEDDVGCKGRTRLIDRWMTVETRLHREAIASQASNFASLAAAKALYLATARGVLHGTAQLVAGVGVRSAR